MAERFRKARPVIGPAHGLLLFLLPLPLIPAAFFALSRQETGLFSAHIIAGVLYLMGALLNRGGLKIEAQYRQQKVTEAPRLPRKFIAALIVSGATLITAHYGVGYSSVFSLFLGILCWAGCFLTYGFDPRKDKVTEAKDGGYTTKEVLSALKEANTKIAAIEKSAGKLFNLELKQRLHTIAKEARRVVSIIEDDPRDLRRARKFLNVYLTGAQQVAEGYVNTHKKAESDKLDTSFRNVLETIETVFREQHDKLLENDVLDLDVQIEVLSKQLKHEGIL